MTPPDITRTWTWTGSRDLPDWLDRRHHWHTDRPIIHTADGPRTLYDGWIVIGWSDGAITVASATVAERVYGPDGIAGRLERAETELAGVLKGEPGVHRYLSTGCYHGDHAYCQSMTGLNGAKRPGECKFCQASCRCGCHTTTKET